MWGHNVGSNKMGGPQFKYDYFGGGSRLEKVENHCPKQISIRGIKRRGSGTILVLYLIKLFIWLRCPLKRTDFSTEKCDAFYINVILSIKSYSVLSIIWGPTCNMLLCRLPLIFTLKQMHNIYTYIDAVPLHISHIYIYPYYQQYFLSIFLLYVEHC